MLERAMKTAMVVGAALTFAACGEPTEQAEQTQDTAALCDAAAEHVRGCFPGDAISVPEDCTAESAQATLDTACEAMAADGKADGFCNPWLWWTCTGGGSDDGGASDGTRDFWANVNVCSDDFCQYIFGDASCSLVTVEDLDGNEIARAHANTSGGVRFEGVDIANGEYVAKLWRRDGEVAENTPGAATSFIPLSEREPAEIPFTVTDDSVSRIRFYVMPDEAEAVRRCAKNLTGEIEALCEGGPTPEDDIEWSWFARLRGETEAGEEVDTIRAYNGRYWFSRLLPGTYTVEFLEMDIPSWQEEPNIDYDEYVERYHTGRTLAHPDELVVTLDDVGAELSMDTVIVEAEECR
jgi:hypothetical protein